MAQGLLKISNYYNRQHAWKDWWAIYYQALKLGLDEDAERLCPAVNAGHRTIDKRISELRKIMEKAVEA